MRAVIYKDHGLAKDVLELVELDKPAPKKGEVLIRVRASGVNPSDVKSRMVNRYPDAPKHDYIIPHSDGAGVIEAVGEGVSEERIGERVWIWNAQWQRSCGTAAEYISIDSEQAVILPESTSFVEGACLGVPAQTAHRCVYADGSVQGLTVLVSGGAGSVGNYAIQMAKMGGAAKVITTVSSEEKAAFARSAGADVIINYRMEDVEARILQETSGEGVDRIVEVEYGGNAELDHAVLKTNGSISAYGSTAEPKPAFDFYPTMFKAHSLRTVLVYVLPVEARVAAAAMITYLLMGNHLKHMVCKTLPFEEYVQAHELVESGACIGNVVLEL